MANSEFFNRELERTPEQDLDRLLPLVTAIETRPEAAMPAFAVESALGKDWLSPEEDEAWAGL